MFIKFYMMASETKWQPQRPWRPLRLKNIFLINSGPKIPVNRYQFLTVYQMMYSGLGGQWPQIEVTIAHRQPQNILWRVTEVTFSSKFEFDPFVAICFAARRNAICFPLNVTYSGLGGQQPRIEVTIAHRKPWTILGGVTEMTFCCGVNRLGGDVEYTYT